VTDWDLAAATEIACDSIVFANAVCAPPGSEAGQPDAGSGIADRCRSVPDRQTGPWRSPPHRVLPVR